MPDPKTRARVVRLLSEDFRPDDLANIFLYIRERCDGRESIAEIGNFVAHHAERDRGITTRAVRDWYIATHFHFPRFTGTDGPLPPLDASCLPPVTKEYLKIIINKLDSKDVRDATGMNRQRAYEEMLKFANRLIQNPDKTWRVPGDYTNSEIKLLKLAVGRLVAQPAFEADRITTDFFETLASNGLITKGEIRIHKSRLGTALQLFTVVTMHNCVVKLDAGATIKLLAYSDKENGSIHVDAPIMNVMGWPRVAILTPMFSAKVDIERHCSAELLTRRDWIFDIELGTDMRLSRLG